ncbi:MAG TPA: hypothetical protein VMB22_00810 [Verrucomicrobiae bacterium]|nr:hypothetical protein [Verrucomicrobiae bacterium]
MNILSLPTVKLKRIIALKSKIEQLQAKLEAIIGGSSAAAKPGRKKWTMSAAARRRISLAAKARWAKVRAAKRK